jgi:hypothetical protein
MKTSKSTHATTKSDGKSFKKIETDFPLSEKDEVKKAERNLQKSQKKNG